MTTTYVLNIDTQARHSKAMDNPDLISIILPTYNGARYLRESVRSCLSQTDVEIELIIVDDASTDDTPAICDSLSLEDPRVRVVHNPLNMRLPQSLNIGFSLARGNYLTWTSDDNAYEPNALGTLQKLLIDHPRFFFAYSDYYTIDDAGNVTGTQKLASPDHLTYYNCVGPCFLYKRDVLSRVGNYSVDMFLCEDYDYWLRVFAQFEMRHIPGLPLYRYRLHNASLTTTKATDVSLQSVRAQCRHLPYSSQLISRLHKELLSAAWQHRKQENYYSSLTCYSEILHRHPFDFRVWLILFKTVANLVRTKLLRMLSDK